MALFVAFDREEAEVTAASKVSLDLSTMSVDVNPTRLPTR